MKRGELLRGLALNVFVWGATSSFESCDNKPKAGQTAQQSSAEDAKEKAKKAAEDKKAQEKAKKYGQEIAAIETFISMYLTPLADVKSLHETACLIHYNLEKFIKEAQFPNNTNRNSSEEVVLLGSKLDRNRLKDAFKAISQ